LKKHITLIGINFYPEDTAIGLYSTQLAEYLTGKGFEVSVITGFPYYPQWKIAENYRDKPRFYSEKHGDIEIFRYKQYVPGKPGFLKRIIHLLDFTFGNYFNLRKIKHTDLVFAVVPFTTDVWLGKKLARKHAAKLWVHIQDFEFDAAIEAKLSGGNNFLFKLLFKTEASLLNKAHTVSTISHAMMRKLHSKINDTPQTYLLPNWVNAGEINPENTQQHPYLSSDKFKILYAGNIGQKQDWDLFLQIAGAFKNNNNAEFIVVGAGAYKETLQKQIADFPNIKMYNPVAFEELSDLLCSADLHLLFQKNEVVDTVMPSKILGMMASARPSVIAGNPASEVAEVIKKSEGGYYFNNDEKEAIIRQIEYLIAHPGKAEITGQNARKYILEHFGGDKILSDFVEKLKEVLEG